MAAAPSPAEMNRRHREFWDVESQVFERRLADPQLVAAATEDMNSEILRRVPIYSRKTMELAFEDAEKRRAKIRSGDGSKGGRPRRGDALQGLIEEIVSARPAISSASALLEQLREFQYQGVVTDIEDDKIWFRDARDASRSAPISGLKNRLTRARKSAKSRKPVSASS
jgi:hypothetical protein